MKKNKHYSEKFGVKPHDRTGFSLLIHGKKNLLNIIPTQI